MKLLFIAKKNADFLPVPVLDYVDQHYQVNFLILEFHLIDHHLKNDDLKPSKY